jgi:inorganic pyrophosphatase
MNPIGKLLSLRYKSHPWHGIDIGEDAPDILTSFIEMVPTDTVKYEADKKTGYLYIDRPQKYSNILPSLYGFIPQTYSDIQTADISNKALEKEDVVGDNDPIDICILTEKEVAHGDILVRARPIGGFRMIDGNEADDKIIGVMIGDGVYGHYKDVSDCPPTVIERLRHYFLTYKDMPGEKRDCEITHVYGAEEAKKVILAGMEDYKNYVKNILFNNESE